MREIPRDEWAGFLDSFSRQHEGWLVSLEVLGAEIGAQVEAQGLPLEGITAELKGGNEDAVTIILGGAHGSASRITYLGRRTSVSNRPRAART
jgi:hypothetical protein